MVYQDKMGRKVQKVAREIPESLEEMVLGKKGRKEAKACKEMPDQKVKSVKKALVTRLKESMDKSVPKEEKGNKVYQAQ